MVVKKVRRVSGLGVVVGFCGTFAAHVYPAHWAFMLFDLVFYGATCGMAAVVWWETWEGGPS